MKRRQHGCLIALLLLLVSARLGAQSVTAETLFAHHSAGALRGIAADDAGNLYLAYDQHDGIRVLELNPTATTVLANTQMGTAGDSAIAIAVDAAANVYVTGTTTSGTLTGTSGVTYPFRTGAAVNSFIAKLAPGLNAAWISFLGADNTTSSALATNGTTVTVTGTTFTAAFPVTANGIQQTPAPASTGSGFVEQFDATSGAVTYATYVTGANGNTAPAAIAEDAGGNVYIAGTTTASGYPTLNALVPQLLFDASFPLSGFVSELAPAGDSFLFSTFLPGDGIQSIALDVATNSILLSGNIASGLFPVTAAQVPIAANATYQSAIRLSGDGQSVLSTLLAPGTSSVIAASPNGESWAAVSLSGSLLPRSALQSLGQLALLHLTSTNTVDSLFRFGGIPANNNSFASLGSVPTGIALSSSNPVLAATMTPTVSDALLSTQTFDVPLISSLNAAFGASFRDAVPSASCGGSACTGGAGLLARVLPASDTASLTLSADDLPNLTLRNVGSASAPALSISIAGFTETDNCGTTLVAGAECAIALTGAGPGSITVTATGVSVSASLPVNTAAPLPVIVLPKELDFGIGIADSPAIIRTLTLTNLTSTMQTVSSSLDQTISTPWSFAETASDCIAAPSGGKALVAGASCHITLGFTPSSNEADDNLVQTAWNIGGHDVILTAYGENCTPIQQLLHGAVVLVWKDEKAGLP